MQLKSAESGMYTDKEIYDAYVEYVKQKNKYEYTKDIIANTEKSSLNSSVLHKKYYIIISCYEEEINTQNYSRDEIQSMIFSELYTRARSIMRTLSRCEVNSKILDSKGLVELLYNAYNREDSDIFSAQTAINAGFDSLYSTAPDVIDKKMKLIIPKAGKSISEVMKEMDADKLQKLSNDMDRCQVDLKFPKFTTEMDLSLNQIISKLGAPSIFQPGTAGFSRFANGSFYVSKMLQKAKIEVSERGTKAAAVTAAVMLTSLGPHEMKRVEFHANRPFVYFITERNSGAILFMGQFLGE